MLQHLILPAAVLAMVGCGALPVSDSEHPLQKVQVRGVEIHYVDSGGTKAPLVFVHGGLSDYREWGPVADALGADYRTVRYSRRYNYPNNNPVAAGSHSAEVEAQDLAALLDRLKLGRAHIAGVSYGAYTALLVALRHPQRVRSLVLVEPPLLRWLPDLPDGAELFRAFEKQLWQPAAAAVASGDDATALRITMDFFAGPGGLDKLPPEVQRMLRANFGEWRALLLSEDAFPPVSRDQLAQLKTPVLMLTGAKTYPIAQLVDPALERALPKAERVVIPDATHEMCTEDPSACASAIRRFLQRR